MGWPGAWLQHGEALLALEAGMAAGELHGHVSAKIFLPVLGGRRQQLGEPLPRV